MRRGIICGSSLSTVRAATSSNFSSKTSNCPRRLSKSLAATLPKASTTCTQTVSSIVTSSLPTFFSTSTIRSNCVILDWPASLPTSNKILKRAKMEEALSQVKMAKTKKAVRKGKMERHIIWRPNFSTTKAFTRFSQTYGPWGASCMKWRQDCRHFKPLV